MGLKGITRSEKNQRKTNTIWFHLHAESKKDSQTKQKQIHRHREQTVAKGDGGEWVK